MQVDTPVTVLPNLNQNVTISFGTYKSFYDDVSAKHRLLEWCDFQNHFSAGFRNIRRVTELLDDPTNKGEQ